MAYVPNPTDFTQPTDAISAETAQAEFRALKGYVASLLGGITGMNVLRKNKIINGRMLIDQRNVGAAVAGITSSTAAYGPDRFKATGTDAAGVFSIQRLSTGLAGASSLNFLRAVVTTIDAAPAVTNTYVLRTIIEGLDCQELLWGTAAAKTVVLSFIVASSISGTFSVRITNQATNRSYIATYNIAVAGTAQYVSIVIPGDIAGVWVVDNTAGIHISWSLGAGTTFQGVAGWQAGNLLATVGSVNLISTLAATFDITDIQLEVAGAASPIEIIALQDELERCQRYFWKTFNQSIAPAQNVGTTTGELLFLATFAGAATEITQVVYPKLMRVAPTFVTYNPGHANAQVYDFNTSTDCSATVLAFISDRVARLLTTGPGGGGLFDQLMVHITANADF